MFVVMNSNSLKRKSRKERKQEISLLKEFVQRNKGESIKYLFRCAICGTTHSSGYLYVINGCRKEVCKFCVSGLTGKGKGTKLIYTPM